ncbi:hypothetical protein J6590_063267 [Homalodisca vitripennis]|nr:hypothetical protein J6590_063267 [Homalodisca vitripennis]
MGWKMRLCALDKGDIRALDARIYPSPTNHNRVQRYYKQSHPFQKVISRRGSNKQASVCPRRATDDSRQARTRARVFGHARAPREQHVAARALNFGGQHSACDNTSVSTSGGDEFEGYCGF